MGMNVYLVLGTDGVVYECQESDFKAGQFVGSPVSWDCFLELVAEAKAGVTVGGAAVSFTDLIGDDYKRLRDYMGVRPVSLLDKRNPYRPPARVEESKAEASETKATKIKSDGGKSGYYWVEIPLSKVEINEEKGVVGFMLEEYIEHGLNNDFDQGNIAKCNHRIGKKAGNTDLYDVNKIDHSNQRLRIKAMEKEKSNG